jgi:hypothetical protein
MAYTALNLGYTPQAGYEYTATTDSNADWVSVPNDTLFFDLTLRQVFYKDANGLIAAPSSQGLDKYTFSQNQWSKTIATPVNLPDGTTANGFTFFDNVLDRTPDGTTTYDQYDIGYSISITLTGTVSSANINVDGVNYLATFDTNRFTTASNWVTTNQAALNAIGIKVFALGSGADGRIRFSALADTVLNAITITPTAIIAGNLDGTIANEFTGSSTASGDHVRIQYEGMPYEGLRLNHNFRVNFGIDPGSTQTFALSLRRFQNDTVIGSEIPIIRNADEPGKQQNFISYTAGASDPFVTGGFWFALRNDSGTSVVDIQDSIGILIQTYYQKPINF